MMQNQVCLPNLILWPIGEWRFSPNKKLVTGWLLEYNSLCLLFIILRMNTVHLKESSFEAWPNMATISAVFRAILCTLKSPLCVSLRILRDNSLSLLGMFVLA